VVEPEVRERFADEGALSRYARTVGVRRVWASRDSLVADVLLGADGRGRSNGNRPERWPNEAVMKIHRRRLGASRPAAERARTEFEVLRDLASREGLRAPQPLYLSQGADWLLMTRCSGHSLLRSVRQCRRVWNKKLAAEACSLLHSAGTWLREFQDRSLRKGAPEQALDCATRRIAEVLLKLGGPVLDPQEAASLTERARALRAAAESGSAVVVRHGDFQPGNVLVSGTGQPVVIDFEGVGEGHPLEDPAYFVVHLGLYLVYPGFAGRRRVLEQAFLAGCGLHSAERSAAFRLFRAAAAARALEDDHARRAAAGPSRGFRRRFLLKALRGVAQ
jgi:aminoglycoside phosphotransferase (APT) family kinase protein